VEQLNGTIKGGDMKKHRGGRFNDPLSRALNKRFGFPEDYTGRIDVMEPKATEASKSESVCITKEG
jgi:hypothetical protein